MKAIYLADMAVKQYISPINQNIIKCSSNFMDVLKNPNIHLPVLPKNKKNEITQATRMKEQILQKILNLQIYK